MKDYLTTSHLCCTHIMIHTGQWYNGVVRQNLNFASKFTLVLFSAARSSIIFLIFARIELQSFDTALESTNSPNQFSKGNYSQRSQGEGPKRRVFLSPSRVVYGKVFQLFELSNILVLDVKSLSQEVKSEYHMSVRFYLCQDCAYDVSFLILFLYLLRRSCLENLKYPGPILSRCVDRNDTFENIEAVQA